MFVFLLYSFLLRFVRMVDFIYKLTGTTCMNKDLRREIITLTGSFQSKGSFLGCHAELFN